MDIYLHFIWFTHFMHSQSEILQEDLSCPSLGGDPRSPIRISYHLVTFRKLITSVECPCLAVYVYVFYPVHYFGGREFPFIQSNNYHKATLSPDLTN